MMHTYLFWKENTASVKPRATSDESQLNLRWWTIKETSILSATSTVLCSTHSTRKTTKSALFPTEIQKQQLSRIRKQKLVCERIYRTYFEIAAYTRKGNTPSELIKWWLHVSNEFNDLCRNTKQAWNSNQVLKKTMSNFVPLQFGKKDELSEVMKRCKSERKGNEFVREDVAAPEPRCVLASKRQISDLIAFCCVERPNNSVLGVDPTFNLGEFYVTFTVYRNRALINENGMHPLFLGPSLIHLRKLYKHLPQVLGNIDQATKLVKAFGTDDEVNLYTALKDEWAEADHLSCSIHMKQNIERKLRDLGIKGGEVTKFVTEIFGTDAEKGILDSESSQEFDAKLHSLESVWNKRECAASKRNKPVFYNWILTEKVTHDRSIKRNNIYMSAMHRCTLLE